MIPSMARPHRSSPQKDRPMTASIKHDTVHKLRPWPPAGPRPDTGACAPSKAPLRPRPNTGTSTHGLFPLPLRPRPSLGSTPDTGSATRR